MSSCRLSCVPKLTPPSGVTTDDSAEPLAKAEAYLFIADVNLYMWDQTQRLVDELDESEGGKFDTLMKSGRQHFLEAHRSKAKSWAARAEGRSNMRDVHGFEERFAKAWDQFDDPQKAYNTLKGLFQKVVLSRDDTYVDLDFISDLRYSVAIFYALLNQPANDLGAISAICMDRETELVLLAGDIAYVYDRLLARPENSAEAYRAIAQANPQTKEGYEAQIEVLKALKQRQRVGAFKEGSADAFDTSPTGLELFKTVNKDLETLVEMSAGREEWVSEDEEVAKADNEAEELVRLFTIRMHGLAQAQKSESFYELAINAYQNYMSLFPKSGHSYQMGYFFAEALYQMGRYTEAYEQYKEALGTNPHGKYREDIIRALVLSAHKRAEDNPLPETAARAEMPDAHRDFIGSGEQFLVSLGDEEPEFAGFVRYEIILRHYLFGEFGVALPLCEAFIQDNAKHAQAPKVAIIWLDIMANEARRGSDREKRALVRTIERIRSTSAIIRDEELRAKLDEVTDEFSKFLKDYL